MVKLENEIVISEIVFKIVHGRKDSKKSPCYEFQLLLIRMFLAIRHVEIDLEEKITMKTLLHFFKPLE